MTRDKTTEQKLADLNQPPLWSGINAYRSDPLLVDATDAMPKGLRDEFDAIGRYVTSPEAQELARMANEGVPQLRTHGPRGERLDVVDYHPAWHALMRRSMASGLHSSLWENVPEEKGRAHKARAVRFYLTAQLECGHLCPLTMTSASVAALSVSPQVQREWGRKILSRKYDSTNKPAMQKSAVTIGMGMTEKQGGTDVRANTSTAERVGEGIYRLSGHKWFMSAPMSDGFVMLAQTREGVGCFLVPRLLEDGSSNGLRFQRLKDKIGNRSNASSEVEFSETFGFLLGTPDAGIRTILDMVTLTRLDCALASSGIMRASLAEAVHHTRGRSVFGKPLVAQPIMTRVLADMALDVAGATALSLRLAEAFDKARDSAEDAAYARIMTPVTKYWCCKIAPALIYEAMECIGGSGYVEERPIARHYREAPVNAIWEGSGNVMALDLMRVTSRGRDLFEMLFAGLARDLGPAGKKTVDVLRAALSLCERDEGAARMLVEQLALAAAAAELYRAGAGRIADAFLETRLASGWRSTYGMLDSRFDSAYIVDLLYPPAR
ncbi:MULTISPECIES: acyl-CoA dehydrogenase family protein [unclassified Shinella]|jgi:putative acyl-CoA dehydrogenase|uniref:acyl-CoA dehydrogenase family protein n=1 Tax=unclassified Shinella TaxID=2643062 RepID=UPI0003C54924|nr:MULTISPECIES: acyl-CoA dehydrogenase family protein [unclassified Shinella]MCA0344925.1 acyl-CoA dehydrogenase family protein [Pseudomonadota bacterium]EYR80748.1 putative acyl-CoA dehydrogenase AidB [Shinella sp. DD12]KNY18349.1 acyl-CoA dehydrogenase [Shinella sp. SUS2]KOC77545.1 acyl-CoA dehydrogenase [Shinella sp. GWS1]MCO5154419.1 acyl-CoA dehydrogenase family protein [Shinella sp.]